MMKNSNKVFTVCTVLFSVCLFSFCKKSSEQGVIPPPNNPPPDTSTYKLVWSDEFDEAAIDANVWNFETGTGTDGWGNHEQEYYQQQNAGIENGNLVITAKKETVGSNHYTSARITTQGKKEFTYGKIEARIKLPAGQGFWPAFWMLGSNISTLGWPVCGETDIMEHINTEERKWIIKVSGLLDHRVQYSEAIKYYIDITPEEEKEKIEVQASSFHTGKRLSKIGRPTKKQRRDWEELTDNR